ncbi:hypothetical protein SUT007_07370 [Streptococcus parasuis]|nr:hypothetical protein SUT007_07370 [Streptococcus parasuis]
MILVPAMALLKLYIKYTTIPISCLLYTSDAADDKARVDLGGRRIIKKKKKKKKARSITSKDKIDKLYGSQFTIY